ncbi:MAG: polysaccharide export protein [Gammaproteobacteria bacterium]|nr:polysaccharide export protein [Gammaproteobacteria bacterium]MDH5731961.1 polysaccharide export protein [Gammaproteobacteria bacterium]
MRLLILTLLVTTVCACSGTKQSTRIEWTDDCVGANCLPVKESIADAPAGNNKAPQELLEQSPEGKTEQAQANQAKVKEEVQYLIGPGDVLRVFVWRNEELSTTVPVRPDGRISLPLVEEVEASDKTPRQLANEIEQSLSLYIKNPKVSVIVTEFGGSYNQQIKVVGEVVNPQAIPYRKNMTVLDAIIVVGGLSEFAAGNRAKIIRRIGGQTQEIPVKLKSLLKRGDIRNNHKLVPGDVILVPETFF